MIGCEKYIPALSENGADRLTMNLSALWCLRFDKDRTPVRM